MSEVVVVAVKAFDPCWYPHRNILVKTSKSLGCSFSCRLRSLAWIRPLYLISLEAALYRILRINPNHQEKSRNLFLIFFFSLKGSLLDLYLMWNRSMEEKRWEVVGVKKERGCEVATAQNNPFIFLTPKPIPFYNFVAQNYLISHTNNW